jgi:peptidoglycan/LPS O-acetylase OafA/YrhL
MMTDSVLPARAETKGRLDVLDGLRGLAILMVVWYHLWLVSGYSTPLLAFAAPLVQNGYLGVDLFFFLSGFCIALPYARARAAGSPGPGIAEFARRRALKIVPSYVLALAIFAIAFRAQFDGPLQELGHFAAHLAFVHVFSPATFGSFSGPLWTLAIEVQFYVLFGLLGPFVVRRPFAVYGGFVAIAVLYRATIAALGVDGDFLWINQLPAVLDLFGAGMAAAFVYVYASARPEAPTYAPAATAAAVLAVAVAVAGLLAVVAVAAAGGDDAVHRWLNAWRIAFGPLLAVVTLGIALGMSRIRVAAGVAPLRGLSVVSYAAYLFNLEIVVALARTGLPAPAVFWLGAIGTLAVAALVTFGFERPLQRAGGFGSLAGLRPFLVLPRVRRAVDLR